MSTGLKYQVSGQNPDESPASRPKYSEASVLPGIQNAMNRVPSTSLLLLHILIFLCTLIHMPIRPFMSTMHGLLTTCGCIPGVPTDNHNLYSAQPNIGRESQQPVHGLIQRPARGYPCGQCTAHIG
ncbi:uncharacterized protein BO80DRAFT_255559 [Aspergillus ibericus CBS 121593]|uniref:Uncharacterized protein n=1 Tax=Aspergillus ibericus CBS 121593 TaxID=1448316 RepID=A0A395HAA5_9EURO|nr:hypothetical protein BO80DRAFT_255559 [Aspergillus ibericus CBS 121593]RAL04085.1 hypothetical protein BO80DRAFT_255559 [Aspergillus ibericus CBS 121593]